MKLSIIIPAYNEEKTVQEAIRRIKKVNLLIKSEIIVVDDGSTDNTFKMIKDIKGIKIYRHTENKGKGAAIKTALKYLTGDIMIVYDADLELYAEDIPKVIQPILNSGAKVVYGSRNIYRKNHFSLFYLGGLFITFVTNFLYHTNLTDEPCGYKSFRTEIIKDLKIESDRFEWEPECTSKIAKKGIKIYEVPVKAITRTEGKKLTYMDGLKAFWTLIKYKFFTK